MLTEENRLYLATLPVGPLTVQDFDYFHGSPVDEDEYLVRPVGCLAGIPTHTLSFFGHTHLQGGFYIHRNGGRYLLRLDTVSSMKPRPISSIRDRWASREITIRGRHSLSTIPSTRRVQYRSRRIRCLCDGAENLEAGLAGSARIAFVSRSLAVRRARSDLSSALWIALRRCGRARRSRREPAPSQRLARNPEALRRLRRNQIKAMRLNV